MSATTLTVPGISCGHCKSAIEGAVGKLDGVRRAEVSVEEKTVTVDYDDQAVSLDTIRGAIIDEGYEIPA